MQQPPYPNMLRALVKDAGLTMREVHRETGIPESTLRRWADGHGVIPSRERAPLARTIGCEVHDLAPLHGQQCTAGADTPTAEALPLSDHMHDLPVVPILRALLAHPEFQAGLALAQDVFLEYYEEAPLSEEQMIEEVEGNLRRRITERGKRSCQALGWDVLSYLHALGFVFDIINHGTDLRTLERTSVR